MNSGLTVALAWQSGRGFTLELSKILTASIESAGHRCFSVTDGDPKALEADQLVLFGNLRAFSRFRALLRGRLERPRTVLWEFDPLPPRSIPPLAERVGLASARLSDRLADLPRLYGFEWSRAIQRLLPWPGFRLSAAMTGRSMNGAPLEARDVRSALKSWSWMLAVLEEGWLDSIQLTTGEKVRFLEARGIECGFAPVGWTTGFGEDRGGERDIDALFLGSLTRRRRQRWQEIKAQLEASGANVVEVGRGLYGEERTRLINRSRILVHLHRIPWDTTWIRWGLATACGALVVSEPLVDPEPMRPGIDHVEAPLDEMADAIRTRLDDPAGSARMVESCRERLRERLAVDASVARVLRAG